MELKTFERRLARNQPCAAINISWKPNRSSDPMIPVSPLPLTMKGDLEHILEVSFSQPKSPRIRGGKRNGTLARRAAPNPGDFNTTPLR
jgi:hypothetical protein